MSPIVNDVKRLRKEHSLTQQELADRAGLLRHTVAYIEDLRHEPTGASMFRIARALDMRVDEIFHYVDEQPTTIIRKAVKVATEVARGGAMVVALVALLTGGYVGSTEIQSQRAFYTGDHIRAMSLQDDVSPLLHPLRDAAWSDAERSAEAFNVGISRGYRSPVPSVLQSRTWLNKYDGLVDRAPIEDWTGWLLHDERADFLAVMPSILCYAS